jgi:tetratricopeptide (TPR) repeat protein
MPRFNKVILILALGALPPALAADDVAVKIDRMRTEARDLARAGSRAEALAIYQSAVALAPNDMPTLRDYAMVLGWDGRYADAIPVIQKVLSIESNQPQWARQEFAASYLFAGHTGAALEMLNSLEQEGDNSERTLLRKGLALRWLGRSVDAVKVYRESLEKHPASTDLRAGLVYSLGDLERFGDALAEANTGLKQHPGDIGIIKAKARILNWAGRHREAQSLLDTVPESRRGDRDILHDRVSASRWGGRPAEAQRLAAKFTGDFPADKEAAKIGREIRFEHGQNVTGGFRLATDSDGLWDRTVSADFSFHATPAHVLGGSISHRHMSQDGDVKWRRIDANWSATLGPHVSLYTAVSSIDYLSPGAGAARLGVDTSLAVHLNDRATVTVGGGRIPLDQFYAARQRLMAPFAMGDIQLRPDHRTRLGARYTYFAMGDGVRRDRVEAHALRRFWSRPYLRLFAGARGMTEAACIIGAPISTRPTWASYRRTEELCAAWSTRSRPRPARSGKVASGGRNRFSYRPD